MNNELKAAAEMAVSRCPLKCSHKSGAHIWNAHQICQWCHATRERYDAALVARDYLSDHPADDGEAVTVEWLESVGFRSWDGDEDEFELYLRIRDEIVWECRLAYQENVIYAVRMCDTEDVGCVLSSESVELLNTRNTKPELTRGDVRRLCAALGITLAESEAK